MCISSQDYPLPNIISLTISFYTVRKDNNIAIHIVYTNLIQFFYDMKYHDDIAIDTIIIAMSDIKKKLKVL